MRVRYERMPDGSVREHYEADGPKVKKKVLAKAGPGPEEYEQAIVTETYDADSQLIRDWRESFGGRDQGKRDGEARPDGGEWPRTSRLSASMADAGLDADALAAKAALPVGLIERHADAGTMPEAAHREAIEAVLDDPFPERRGPPPASELFGNQGGSPPSAAEPGAAQREARSKQRDAHAADRRKQRRDAVERRERADAARLAELRTLSGIAPKLRRLQEKLGR
jgi:hypothetical protein